MCVSCVLIAPGVLAFRWLNGDCRFGDRCNFAHGETELRTLPGRGRGRGRGVNSRTAGAGRAIPQGTGASDPQVWHSTCAVRGAAGAAAPGASCTVFADCTTAQAQQLVHAVACERALCMRQVTHTGKSLVPHCTLVQRFLHAEHSAAARWQWAQPAGAQQRGQPHARGPAAGLPGLPHLGIQPPHQPQQPAGQLVGGVRLPPRRCAAEDRVSCSSCSTWRRQTLGLRAAMLRCSPALHMSGPPLQRLMCIRCDVAIHRTPRRTASAVGPECRCQRLGDVPRGGHGGALLPQCFSRHHAMGPAS